MTTATWHHVILAQSDRTIIVENYHYFPIDSINKEYFTDSDFHTKCEWKGTCNYYNIKAYGKVKTDAAWYYPEPKDAANNIKGYVAFWKGVRVE